MKSIKIKYKKDFEQIKNEIAKGDEEFKEAMEIIDKLEEKGVKNIRC